MHRFQILIETVVFEVIYVITHNYIEQNTESKHQQHISFFRETNERNVEREIALSYRN